MTKENLKRAGITVAVVVASAVAVKLLPITWTLSAVCGFIAGTICTYLWGNNSQ